MLNTSQELIFERYKYPLHAGEIKNATFSLDGVNLLCGDEIHIDALVVDNRFSEIKHSCRACAICTAATDLLVDELTGKAIQRIGEIDLEFMKDLIAIPLSPMRIKCALLPLETLKQAQV